MIKRRVRARAEARVGAEISSDKVTEGRRIKEAVQIVETVTEEPNGQRATAFPPQQCQVLVLPTLPHENSDSVSYASNPIDNNLE